MSLGNSAFGSMATRFNTAGHKPVAQPGDWRPDLVCGRLPGLREVEEALDGHGISGVASGLHLDPRFAKGAFAKRERGAVAAAEPMYAALDQ